MEGILELEREILLFFQDTIRNPVLNPVWIGITTLGNAGLIWVLLSLGLMVPKKTRRVGVTSLLALVVSLLINNVLLKNLVGRVRPYDLLEGLNPLIGKQWDPSFPSGHTGSSFAAAWVLYRRLPAYFGIPALILAGLIGISRLYVGVHYPTDVLFGLVSGIGSGWIALELMSLVGKRKG